MVISYTHARLKLLRAGWTMEDTEANMKADGLKKDFIADFKNEVRKLLATKPPRERASHVRGPRRVAAPSLLCAGGRCSCFMDSTRCRPLLTGHAHRGSNDIAGHSADLSGGRALGSVLR